VDTEAAAVEVEQLPARPFWRRHLVGIVAVAGLVLLGAWAVGSWATRPHAPDYSGQTRRISVTFQCTNDVIWLDPASSYDWWAGDEATVPSRFDTSPTTPGDVAALPYHHVAGRLHFDSATRATFTSNAGGAITMTRERTGTLHTTECRFQG
jgi:hypothetical protein